MARQAAAGVGLLIGPVPQAWVIPFLIERDHGPLVALFLAGSLAGVVLIARLIRSPADLITRELALPTARIAAPGDPRPGR